MRFIKINKHWRNGGHAEHTIFVSDDTIGDSDINDMVEEWCSNQSGGQSYGWESEWSVVTDPNEIVELTFRRINLLSDKISYLQNEKMNLIKTLKYYQQNGEMPEWPIGSVC